MTAWGGTLWRAALSTTAAPTIFESVARSYHLIIDSDYPDGSTQSRECLQELVDGGVVENCSAAVGIKVATVAIRIQGL